MKPRLHARFAHALLLVLALGLAPERALAQDSIADFYKGKTVTVVSSGGVGGPIDLACRMVAILVENTFPAIRPSWCATCRAAATC
jgi:tripartite-type tricarboxylate transporter receptor subunit TctC